MAWNQGTYPPPDPNQYGYGQQPPYPGPFPPPGGYPSAPPPGAAYPGQTFPGGFPGAGFHPPPPTQGGMPYGQMPPMHNYQSDMYGTNYTGGEDPEVKGFDFTDKAIRRGFIRKVYSILLLQLSVTLGFICLFVYHKPTQNFVAGHPELWIVAIIVLIVSLIALSCCGELRRKTPTNYIMLTLFTVAESFFLAMTASRYNSEEVVMAVGITAAVCLALTLFAFQTKIDFTVMSGALFIALVILFIFGIVAMIWHNKIVSMVYASLGALLFSIYLVYDTQMMLGGNHKYSISPEEYIFAALSLYLDVINIFMYILTIIGAARD